MKTKFLPYPSFTLFVAIMLLATTYTAQARSWYVKASAIGKANGTSTADAWTSLSTINQSVLADGDIVFIQEGVYDERLTLTKGASSPSNRIIYKGVGAAVVRGITATNISNVALLGIEFTQPSSSYNFTCLTLNGCSGWLIQDCYFHDTYGDAIDLHYNTLNNNNIIRHNLFSNINGAGNGAGGAGIGIYVSGNSNLIEYNTVLKSLDRVRVWGTGNIVRNNYWGATDTSFYPSAAPYPFHTDGFQSYANDKAPLRQVLYERNFDADNRDTVGGASNAPNGHGIIIQDSTGANGINWIVFRFNVLTRTAQGVSIMQNVNKVYFYNNTFVQMGIDYTTLFHAAITWNSGTQDTFDIRNCTFDFNPNMLDSNGLISTSNRPTNFSSARNHTYNLGTQAKLPTGANPANIATSDPLFQDGTGAAGHDDYTLRTGSPLIGSAAPLTTATSAGTTSTQLVVSNALVLCDGWGIAEGDWIRVGSSSYAQISSINYSTNVVTLSSALTWNTGDGVFVKGSEDVGALPSKFALSFTITNTCPTLVAGPNILTATASNPEAVRKVEYLVDGIPVGEAYAPPYSVNYTADGSTHTVTARAYSLWANTIAVAEADIGSVSAIAGIGKTTVAPGIPAVEVSVK